MSIIKKYIKLNNITKNFKKIKLIELNYFVVKI